MAGVRKYLPRNEPRGKKYFVPPYIEPSREVQGIKPYRIMEQLIVYIGSWAGICIMCLFLEMRQNDKRNEK